jgi:hypothetical protein
VKKILLAGLLLFCTVLTAQQNSSLNIYFDSDSWRLDQRAKNTLDSFCISIKNRPDLRIKMSGHTDSIADANYNQQLSEKRVLAVKQYLEQKGVTANFESAGYAYSRPAASNSTALGRQTNRRVEIVVVTPPKPNDSIPVVKFIAPPIAPDSTIIRGALGTIIKIPEGAFGNTPNSSVNITVKEFFDMNWCPDCNITTRTNLGQCLESGGMVFLSASAGDTRIDSLTGQMLMQVWIPADSADTSMQLYESTPIENGLIGWKSSPRKLVVKEDGKKYYVFETNVLSGCNIDKLGACPAVAADTFISTGRFRGNLTYMTTTQPNTSIPMRRVATYRWQASQIAKNQDPTFTSYASRHRKSYVAVVSFSDLKKKTRKGKTFYKIKRKYYVRYKPEDRGPSARCPGF